MKPSVGDTLPAFQIESVSPEAMKDWAEFLQDPNPIHLDVAAVQEKGLGDKRMNQGPANAAYVINMILAAFPNAEIENLESRFVDNVWEDDCAEAFGTVIEVEDAGNYWRVVSDTGLKTNGEKIVLTGKAVVRVPK